MLFDECAQGCQAHFVAHKQSLIIRFHEGFVATLSLLWKWPFISCKKAKTTAFNRFPRGDTDKQILARNFNLKSNMISSRDSPVLKKDQQVKDSESRLQLSRVGGGVR